MRWRRRSLIAGRSWTCVPRTTGELTLVTPTESPSFTVDGVFDGPPGRFEGRAAIAAFNRDIHPMIRGSMHFNSNHQFERRSDHLWHRCYSILHLVTDAGVQPQLMAYEDVVVDLDGDCGFAGQVNGLFDATRGG